MFFSPLWFMNSFPGFSASSETHQSPRTQRMAATFVPVPVPPVNRSRTWRSSPTPAALSIHCELSAPRSAVCWLRRAAAQDDTSPDASEWIPRQDLWDGMSTLLEIKGGSKPPSLTPTLLGYEVLQKRTRSTVNIYNMTIIPE